ncbi:MAG: biotin--[acetyl-CoA-carboxylase] ligase [Chloroflexi bacterium RIFCSPLOWO2_12_FULL_71_12]|nr:MAG: biotin--[acetyl-CoA-carboxylase] ligase [Chloroflexi bacterium RIFCSPLOWO2_12_FULL_71_12]
MKAHHERLMDRLGLLADRGVRGAVGRAIGREIEHHARITSTQDRARELVDAGCGPMVVVADEQTAGRGRQGRTWSAPPGTSLLASWVFRPLPSDPALFALLAGVAVARALEALGVPGARLKWPNDVQLGGKKLAGTLGDAVTAPDGGALVLGIGVNAGQSAADLGELAAMATSCRIEGHEVDRLALLARITAQLDLLAASPDERRTALDEWRSRSSVLGREVEVRGAAGSVRGLAREVAEDGALVLETASGDRRILAGEVSLI